MNFLAKHFFEYQTFVNLPYKSLQLHKTPPSQAGSDQSATWGPKSMTKAGKNQSAPGSRASRNNIETKTVAHRHGRPGKHEFREWGNRHGELRTEKIAPHKDLWTKFLSNEPTHQRNLFDCEFEDKILGDNDLLVRQSSSNSRTIPATTLNRVQYLHDTTINIFLAKQDSSYQCSNPSHTHVLAECTIRIDNGQMCQWIAIQLRHKYVWDKGISDPFARLLLFDGRQLIEQRQTTFSSAPIHIKWRKRNGSSASAGRDTTFPESFLFNVTLNALARCHIVVEIYDHERESGSIVLVGRTIVGGAVCNSNERGADHWHQMTRRHGFPIALWHSLIDDDDDSN